MRIVLAVLALVLATTVTRQAEGAEPSGHALRSQAHYEAGRQHFRAGEFAEAVREFEEGYRWEPRPLFLFLIGQAARRDKQVDKALRSYRQFLELDRNAPERAKVREYIAELERELASATPVTPPAPTPTVVPAPAVPSVAPSIAATPPVVTTPQPSTLAVVVAPARSMTRSRRGMWAGIGVGIGLVVGGVILAVVLTTPKDVPTSPLGNYRWGSP